MSEGFAAAHVRLRDAGTGRPIDDALLPIEPELWDRHRCRLTVLLDPARIKRGLVPHEEAGYALAVGTRVEVIVDEGFLDAKGRPLSAGARRHYDVADDLRDLIEPSSWRITVPEAGTKDELAVEFGRPIDRGLLQWCVMVTTTEGRPLDGDAEIASAEDAWSFRPHSAWPVSPLQLIVDPILEDVAGNSLLRVFDRDIEDASTKRKAPSPYRPPSTDQGVDITVVARQQRA